MACRISPEVSELIATQPFYQEGLRKVAALLPESDAELHDWIASIVIRETSPFTSLMSRIKTGSKRDSSIACRSRCILWIGLSLHRLAFPLRAVGGWFVLSLNERRLRANVRRQQQNERAP